MTKATAPMPPPKFTAIFSPDFVYIDERLRAMDKQGVEMRCR